MKNQITLVLLLFATLQLAAQGIKEVSNPSISSSGTAFRASSESAGCKGTLQVIMEDEEGNPIFDKIFSQDEEFTTDSKLAANQPYEIRFIGNNTKGSYLYKWIEKTNQ